MKFRKTFLIMPLLLAVTSLTGCGEPSEEEQAEQEQKEAYYEDCHLDYHGQWLESELQVHSFEKHQVYVKYGQINSYYKETNSHKSVEGIPGTDKNQWFYSGREKSGISNGNREHVWPCANSAQLWVHGSSSSDPHNVDGSKYKGGGSDLYHVRLANKYTNTLRGNSKFVDFDDEEFEAIRDQVNSYNYDDGKYDLLAYGESYDNTTGRMAYANKVEVDDAMKGDVARIILYLYMHYLDRGETDAEYSDMVGNLELTNVIGYTEKARCVYKLVEWNEMDPPSNVEKQRNQTVQKIQGNRNPFVDHPELARRMFQDDYVLPEKQ